MRLSWTRFKIIFKLSCAIIIQAHISFQLYVYLTVEELVKYHFIDMKMHPVNAKAYSNYSSTKRAGLACCDFIIEIKAHYQFSPITNEYWLLTFSQSNIQQHSCQRKFIIGGSSKYVSNTIFSQSLIEQEDNIYFYFISQIKDMFLLFLYMNHYKIGENQEITYIDGRQTLGAGRFANVYEGYKSNNMNQRYAVKKIFRKHINQDRQIQILKKLEHDNVIKFFQSYKNLHFTYIITELCDKENLELVIQKQKGFNQEKVIDYSYQILCGVYYLHYKLKVMHRDLKTQNILLKYGKIKIADFGCSKDIDSDLDILKDLQQSIVGTPTYCSPQLTHQQPYSAKCDVWSIGCIIYEMITGQKLFPYEKTKQLKEDQQNQRYINKIKEKLRDKNEFWTQLLIDKMLVYQEKSRSTVEQLFREISVEREKKNKANIKNTIQYKTQMIYHHPEQYRKQLPITASKIQIKPIIFSRQKNYKKIGSNQEVAFNINLKLSVDYYGFVYEGIMDTNSKMPVEIKILHDKGATLKNKNLHFEREIDTLYKLDNSHIIKYHLHYIDPETDNIFIVSEKIQSQDFSKYIGKMSPQAAFKYAYQLVSALKYIHEQGCIHQDISPENVLLTSQGNVKIAFLKGQRLYVNYAAPQIIFQQDYSNKCDVWSVGCLIYQMLTGNELFKGENNMILRKKYQNQFKQPEKKAKYLEQIKDSFWYEVLDQMLTYQDQKRPSFRDILPYFEEENKKQYHINIEGEKQVQSNTKQSIEERTTIHQDLKATSRINGFIRSVRDYYFMPIDRQRIRQESRLVKQASWLMIFKYQKIKLIQKYICQLQQAKNYPVDVSIISILSTLFLIWFKMEILEFINQFKGDEYIIYESQKIMLSVINGYKNGSKIHHHYQQCCYMKQQFIKARNKMLNGFSYKLSILNNRMKLHIDFIFQDEHRIWLEKIKKKYPELIKMLQNYQETKLSSQIAAKLFQSILKDYGMPLEKIKQLKDEQKPKIYRLLAALFLLIEKQKKFPDSLSKNGSHSGDKMNEKFQEIQKMAQNELILIIK